MLFLLMGLIVAALFDYGCKKIPNWLIVLLFFWGMTREYILKGIPGLFSFPFFFFLIVFLFFPFFRIGTLGAGDIKLLGVCAPFFPSDRIIWFLFCTMAVAAFSAVLHFVYYGNAPERFRYLAEYTRECLERKEFGLYEERKKQTKKNTICMAGPVLISTLLYLGGVY